MCTVCGCSGEGAAIERGKPHGHAHGHDHHHHGEDHHHHDHHHEHGGHHHHHGPHGDLDFGGGPAGAHVAGLSQARIVEIETNILAKNDAYADENRARLRASATLALNLVSSPGSGKTTLLVETIKRMGGECPVGVIEGDQQTSNDADRIRATGAPAIQINTGKGCHLDAHMVGHAIDHLRLPSQSVLFIENVGNLVCPAAFDLGENAKVVILSVTEGEDKPLKYPDMFAAARLMILNKIDLAPHVDFDIAACEANARRINPGIEILRVSARTGEGMDGWIGWIMNRRRSILESAVTEAEARLASLKRAVAGQERANG